MAFQPTMPFGGTAGWSFLTRTMATQKAAMQASPVVKRDMDYFRANIAKVGSAEDLVKDYTLLKVALGAFGLQEDLPNKFFVRKVLEEGVFDQTSLANRLSDPRYSAFSKAFGFGGAGVPRTVLSGFPDEILSAYSDQTFEVAVGDTQPELRLALGLDRELDRVLKGATSADAHWFGVMGSPPLRNVFETAFGLPESFAALDIDQQLRVFRTRADAIFGAPEVADFAAPEMLEGLRDRFLLLTELDEGSANLASTPVLGLLSDAAGSIGSASVLSALYSA